MMWEKCHCSSAGYTMFLVFPPEARMYRFVGCPTLEHATYDCPSVHGFYRWIPANFQGLSLCPVDGHCKCEANRELYPFEVEGQVCWDKWYPCNEYIPFARPVRIVASIR
jgi:hypothetical protein